MVHADGSASDLRLSPAVDNDAAKILLAWVETCAFTPARAADGGPISLQVRWSWHVEEEGTFGAEIDQDPADPPLYSSELLRPVVPPGCGFPIRTGHPELQEAKGILLVSYAVGSNGQVRDITLKNPGHPGLFELVRDWLSDCRLEPARTKDGLPVAVRIVHPFVFQ